MAQRGFLTAFAALAIAFGLGGAAPTPAIERWIEIVGPDGQPVGFQHESESATPQGRTLRRERYLAVKVDGHGESRTRLILVRHYGAAGRLEHFRFEQQAGDQQLAVDGTVAGGTLSLVRMLVGKRTARSFVWPEGQDLADPLAFEQQGGARFELAPGGLRLDRRELRLVAQGDGRVLRLGYVDGRLDSAEVAGKDAIEQPQLGFSMTLRQAAGPLAASRYAKPQRIPHEMWKSPFYVSAGALRGQIRYRFGFRHGFAGSLPQTGEQAVKPVEGGWQLDICARCGPGFASDAQSLARWRQPTPWIQSDAPEIVAAVRALLRPGLSESARMGELARLARARLARTDFEGYYPARAAWRHRAGDCTEDAVVLAALARAAGIPARVASGITYSRTRYHGAADAFLPHAWVIAWVDGRWQSYDISLEGFDASHIALSLSDGEPGGYIEAMRLAALLDWQGMSEVRKRN